ncbi:MULTISPECIES: fatty acid desaturase [Pseudanabaena]|uniref:fatty acid desaturase n=1 Tax=Pseudanabaena TaxID=1152 RepID=UPI002479A83A|nr:MULTISPECIES: fatty acid desaturase [Pseudanabaena]MEA5488896.1 fatty acid desaturase [Pseudanabaena sp. CCNP1317]WGS72383.1 fatty acid desaturase [Pseudanabaena galeata CCNP1313]
MVAIQNSSHTLTPETTLRDIIKTIPSEYFEKKPLRAWLSVLFSLTTAALGYASIAFSPWYLLPFAWIFTGTALTGWFVIGHDCGHRSFSNKIWINDLVGHIAFLPLIFPFHGWRFKHDHHHQHTNKMGEDNAWYPFTVEEYEEGKGLISGVYRLIRTRFWWIGSIIHWANLHFNSSLYPERQREQVKFSYRLVIVFAAITFPVLIYTTGFLGFINFFLMPWLVYHFWMSTFTIVHHTMPDIQFKDKDKWHAATDQLTGTVHCDYPAWVEWLCHDINVHVPHHISTGIPSYNLRLAHKSLDENWGQYMYKTKFSWELMKDIGDRCHIYDAEKCYKTFTEVDAKSV